MTTRCHVDSTFAPCFSGASTDNFVSVILGLSVMSAPNRNTIKPAWPPHSIEDDSWALTGDIARLGLASVLQFLEFGRHTGTLLCADSETRPGECVLNEGRVARAQHGHLVDSEAVIAMLGWQAGRFAFSMAEVDVAGGPVFSTSPLIMESVRLEDEFERIAPDYPGDDFVLRLVDPYEFPLDPLGCGADVVMAMLAARNSATVRELTSSVGLAPIKLKLTAAWLCHTERVKSVGASRQNLPAMSVARLIWFQQLLVRFSGGLRVVLALDGSMRTHEVIASIKALAKELDSGPVWMSLAPNGTSMARVRPRAGGLLSIACVPISEEHEASFERFAATSDLVLLCEGVPEDKLAHWSSLADVATVIRMPQPMDKSCLRNALVKFSSLSAQT